MIAILILIVFVSAILGGPFTWLAMLALGNFGFAQFGFIDCIPLGLILAAIASNAGD